MTVHCVGGHDFSVYLEIFSWFDPLGLCCALRSLVKARGECGRLFRVFWKNKNWLLRYAHVSWSSTCVLSVVLWSISVGDICPSPDSRAVHVQIFWRWPRCNVLLCSTFQETGEIFAVKFVRFNKEFSWEILRISGMLRLDRIGTQSQLKSPSRLMALGDFDQVPSAGKVDH